LEKAPDAFRTISEVADEIDVPQHVLRFWESRFAQIRPMKRGGGRRYYRPDDIDLLRGVRHLLYGEGYTIRGVQRILRDEGPGFVQNVWRAGAEPPPPQLDEDNEGDEIEAAPADARKEPDFSAFTAAPAREPSEQRPPGRQEAAAATPAQPARAGVSAEERRKLQAALNDLLECQRLIEAALTA
jgi:DNA-binding transcriptional MerR regulator